MDQDNTVNPTGPSTTLCRKAWTVYLSTVAMAVVFLIACSLIAPWAPRWLTTAVAIVCLCVVAYRWMVLRSYHLYYNDLGVWLYSGILPWSKGVRGVKWRDLDEATFTQGFSSWVLRSYHIRVGHRFTKDSEISLSSMYNGKEAVRVINQVHQQLVAQDKLH